MLSDKSIDTLVRIHALRGLRRRQAHHAWRRRTANCDEARQALDEIEAALLALAKERDVLIEQCRGVLSRGALFTLRRHSSLLESRRIDLTLDYAEQASRLARTQQAQDQAHVALMLAQHQHEKLLLVLELARRDAGMRQQWREEYEIEETHYVR